MRLDSVTPERVHVTLSKRNLLALLSKVDVPDSAKTIFMEYPVMHPSVNDGDPFILTLYVTAEQDEAHYADRPEGGDMTEWTEQFIAEREGA